MKLAAKLASALIATAAFLAPSLSSASVVFTITRLSDQQALISGTGTLDANASAYIAFAGSGSTGDQGVDPFGGNFSWAGTNVSTVFQRVGTNYFMIVMSNNLAAGTGPSGTLNATLDANEIWSAVGTFGNVFDETSGSVLGTYSIVGTNAVPEPGSLALLGLGLAGLAASVRRRKTA